MFTKLHAVYATDTHTNYVKSFRKVPVIFLRFDSNKTGTCRHNSVEIPDVMIHQKPSGGCPAFNIQLDRRPEKV
jgi:hypothetical protein